MPLGGRKCLPWVPMINEITCIWRSDKILDQNFWHSWQLSGAFYFCGNLNIFSRVVRVVGWRVVTLGVKRRCRCHCCCPFTLKGTANLVRMNKVWIFGKCLKHRVYFIIPLHWAWYNEPKFCACCIVQQYQNQARLGWAKVGFCRFRFSLDLSALGWFRKACLYFRSCLKSRKFWPFSPY